MISQAFVLGAGLGTRLKTLTQHRPKPLIPVANRPLITYAFDHLRTVGVEKFVINTHWRADVYGKVFPQPEYEGLPLTFREEQPEVLETAGGIKNVEKDLQGGSFWVYNGDILSTIPLQNAWRVHHESRNEVTLVLRSKDGPLQISMDRDSGRIADIGRRIIPEREPQFLFTGIYIVNPDFFARIPPATKLSVVPIFCEMIRNKERLGGVVIDEGDWYDLGTREQYLAVHHALDGRPWIDPTAKIGRGGIITGATAIGPNASIGEGARIHDSIIWENGRVAPEADLDRVIVASGFEATGRLENSDVA